MSHYSTFSNCKSTKVTKDKPPCLVDGSFSVEGKTRGYPAIYDYYRGMGYKEGDFFRKGMSNVSTVKLGDDRLRFETTLQHDSMKMVDDAAMAAGTRRRGSNGVRVLKPAECERRYRLALATVGMEALVVMEASLRLRLAEKTGGGAFQLRKTFKYFDKDGSGRIDIGEFTDALGSIGFAYNESQILALFGRYDEDLDGQINYNEFVRGVMEDDFQSDPFSRQVFANVPELERKMKSTIKQYEQKMEEEDAFDDTEALEMEHQEVCRLFKLVDRAQSGSIANDDLPLLLAALGLVGSEEQLASARNQVREALKRLVWTGMEQLVTGPVPAR